MRCTRCGRVFMTPALSTGDEVRVVRFDPDLGLLEPVPRRRAKRAPVSTAPGLHETSQREPGRRWFVSSALEVIVWLDEGGQPRSFRVCYRDDRGERAVTWSEGKLTHARVEAEGRGGDDAVGYKPKPVLVTDLEFDGEALLRTFEREAGELPAYISEFITSVLARFRLPRNMRS